MLIPFDQLFKRHQIRPMGVVHLGASAGQEADAYAAHGIQQVIWVEALWNVYLRLVQNVSKYPGSIALCACVSDVDDAEVFFS